MFGAADWPHAGATASMRNAKCFVQVDVANVSAEFARPAQTHLSVQVGTVHIHLPAVLVDDRADLFDRLFEYAVSRWIRHHQARQICGMFCRFYSQIGDIYIAMLVAGYGDDAKACHHRTGWICSVR